MGGMGVRGNINGNENGIERGKRKEEDCGLYLLSGSDTTESSSSSSSSLDSCTGVIKSNYTVNLDKNYTCTDTKNDLDYVITEHDYDDFGKVEEDEKEKDEYIQITSSDSDNLDGFVDSGRSKSTSRSSSNKQSVHIISQENEQHQRIIGTTRRVAMGSNNSTRIHSKNANTDLNRIQNDPFEVFVRILKKIMIKKLEPYAK